MGVSFMGAGGENGGGTLSDRPVDWDRRWGCGLMDEVLGRLRKYIPCVDGARFPFRTAFETAWDQTLRTYILLG